MCGSSEVKEEEEEEEEEEGGVGDLGVRVRTIFLFLKFVITTGGHVDVGVHLALVGDFATVHFVLVLVLVLFWIVLVLHLSLSLSISISQSLGGCIVS